jgi:hypothetical protein
LCIIFVILVLGNEKTIKGGYDMTGLLEVNTSVSYFNCGGKNGNGFYTIWIIVGELYLPVGEEFETEKEALIYAYEKIDQYFLSGTIVY